jgi:6-phosphogluconate dehydrogenase
MCAVRVPRVILFVIRKNSSVDAIIAERVVYRNPAGLIINCGMSHFNDNERREK